MVNLYGWFIKRFGQSGVNNFQGIIILIVNGIPEHIVLHILTLALFLNFLKPRGSGNRSHPLQLLQLRFVLP
jgi:hypothetical protein